MHTSILYASLRTFLDAFQIFLDRRKRESERKGERERMREFGGGEEIKG